MKEIIDPLSADKVSPGTMLLGVSPPLTGIRPLTDQYLADVLDEGGSAIVVSAERGSSSVSAAIVEATTTDDVDSRLAIVDATGQQPASDPEYSLKTVSSPADLTGIGMAVTELLERFCAADARPVWVVVDSLSTLLVYAEFDRVYRFTHAITNRIEAAGGVCFAHVQPDTDEAYLPKFQTLFDGQVELREQGSERQYRVRGIPGYQDRWQSIPESVAASRTSPPATSDSRDRTPATTAEPSTPSRPDSLHAIIDAVRQVGYTVTIANYTGDDAHLADLERYLAPLNATLRTAELDVETPRDVAILHRGGDSLAMSPVAALHNAIALDSIATSTESPPAKNVMGSRFLAELNRREYTIENDGKASMLRVSRLAERQALESGTGILHAGFQQLSRLRDDPQTRQLYHRLAATDVDLHLYGRADDGYDPKDDFGEVTVHHDRSSEIETTWFVVYDGASRSERMTAVIAEETSPDQFTGCWTYQPETVMATDQYLRTAYPAADA